MATERLHKIPSTSYQSNTDLHLMYQHRCHNARSEAVTASLQKATESENKMEAPRSFEAPGNQSRDDAASLSLPTIIVH